MKLRDALKYKKETVMVALHNDNELNKTGYIKVYYSCSINISFPSLTLALIYVFSFWLWGWSFNLKCKARSISDRTPTLWFKIHTEKNFSADDLAESLGLSDIIFFFFFIFSLLSRVTRPVKENHLPTYGQDKTIPSSWLSNLSMHQNPRKVC